MRSPSPTTGAPAERRRSPSPAAHSRSPAPRRADYSSQEQPRRFYDRRSEARSPPPPTKPTGKPCRILGVFGLNMLTRERHLSEVFSPFGPITKVQLVYDTRSQRSRGFGFIYFEHQEDAERALEKCNGMFLDGRYIRVDYSVTQKPHSPTPGHYLGERADADRDGPAPRGYLRRPPPEHDGGRFDRRYDDSRNGGGYEGYSRRDDYSTDRRYNASSSSGGRRDEPVYYDDRRGRRDDYYGKRDDFRDDYGRSDEYSASSAARRSAPPPPPHSPPRPRSRSPN